MLQLQVMVTGSKDGLALYSGMSAVHACHMNHVPCRLSPCTECTTSVAACRQRVLELVGPTEGTCAPGCGVTLNWLFNPITPAMHKVSIPISAMSSAPDSVSCASLTLEAQGFLPDRNGALEQHHASATGAATPRGWHSTPIIKQNPLLSVSETSLALGYTELQGVLRRLVVLRPVGDTAVAYAWDMGVFAGGSASEGWLHAEPASGTLLPGETAVCQLVYTAGVEAQWLQGEIAVNVRALSDDEAAELCHDEGVRSWTASLAAPCVGTADGLPCTPASQTLRASLS